MNCPDQELNRVLGGGFVPGSLVLMGGEPGIGKSTLMLQLALKMEGKKILYVSGEESARQIKMRATRIHASNNELYLYSGTDCSEILEHCQKTNPDLVVVDSIQTIYSPMLESAPGTVSQIRQCTAEFLKMAKSAHFPILLIGHITKDGSIAGPKVLEHMVDTVLQFEGDRNLAYRILRTTKKPLWINI